MTSLTAENVANCLPLLGQSPHIKGRIINVTHQIPYNILRAQYNDNSLPLSPPRSPSSKYPAQSSGEISPDPVEAAPISKLARHHRRGNTLRMRFHAADWTVVERRGHQALYAGLQSLRKDYETVHIGWTGPIKEQSSRKLIAPNKFTSEDKTKLQTLLWDTGRTVPVFLGDESDGHYQGYCKQVLWPVFHYLVKSTSQSNLVEKSQWADYVAVNRQFAQTVINRYQPNDIIFINDYHLLLVPEMIREKLPEAAIGIFIHATFPSSEIFRCLQTRKEILNGMLGANLVGFQTYSYARHFISSCTRVLGCETTQIGVNHNGTLISVSAFPIGVDCNRVLQFSKQPGVMPKINAIRDMHSGKKIIAGRDKLDTTKGILQKLHAFEGFLRDYPEWRNKVVLIQVATPTHGDHSRLEAKISETVSHINGKYGSLEHTPIHYYHQDIDRDEYYALLSVADLALITCSRDGMNTTSYEYTLCQHHKTVPGQLILSEFAGTAGSMSAAILVNPWDYAEVAKCINDALTMSLEEKATRHEQLYRHVTSSTADFWAHSFIKQLVTVSQQQGLQSHATPTLDYSKLSGDYKSAKKRAMFFDYDGTLTPIVSAPSDATPSPEMIKAIQVLCNDPNNIVWIISGRDQSTLDEWIGENIENINLSAEHGCYIKYANAKQWESIVDNLDMSWKNDVIEIFNYYTERTIGSFVEHKKSSVTWHYRQADKEYGTFQAKECQNHLENAIVSNYPVEILVGKKNLEVRPMSINKGEIVKRILSKNLDTDLVVCAGDDKTDEDMFRALGSTHQKASAIWPKLDGHLYSITTNMLVLYIIFTNWPCVRLLNATGVVGCQSRKKKSGILYQAQTQQDLEDLPNIQTSEDIAIILPLSLLDAKNIRLLTQIDHITGIIALITNATKTPSPDSTCPNCEFGLYANDPDIYQWNEQALGLIQQSFDIPIFAIKPTDDKSKQTYDHLAQAVTYNKERQYKHYPLKAIDFNLFMWAAVNSETCLRRGWYDNKPIILVSANLDSRALFHDLVVGSTKDVSGVVAVLAIAEALSRAPTPMDTLPKHVLYTLFTAESWGFAGSQRFVKDISSDFVCTNATRAVSCPYLNAPCTFPCVRNIDFKRIQFEKIETIFELQSVSGMESNSQYYVHVDSDDLNQQLVTKLQSYSNIKAASADGIRRKLPPSSSMSFLKKNRNIRAAVITDYQSQLGE
ncbi:glycosyltransferase family 20-domain-containing protein [Sporodiniella umbellata]|nr:glycosyltransferase family 20-domain-containing protein [Sporodiniella umbellata]